jgi:hypothetical protein
MTIVATASAQDSFIELGRTRFGANEYLLVGLGTTPTSATTMNPFQARDAADAFGGWLFAVNSLEENNTVAAALAPFRNPATNSGDFWIGFTDRSSDEDPIYGVAGAFEGNIGSGDISGWRWSNGDPVSFTNWNLGGAGNLTEPNDVGSGEDWAEIWVVDNPSSPNYLQWNDESDTHAANWAIVERVGVPPPLVLEVNPATGQAYLAATFSSDNIASITLTDYQLEPGDATFDVAAWQTTNLTARGVDAIGTAAGEAWETLLGTPGILIESYFLGGSQFSEGDRLYLGQLFAPGTDPALIETVVMQYAINVDAVDNANDATSVLRGTRPADPITVVLINSLGGDFNGDGLVDAADYTVWRDNLGAPDELGLAAGSGNGVGGVDNDDYLLWRSNFGATSGSLLEAPATVPEPTSAISLAALIALVFGLRAIHSRPTGT